MRGARTFLRDFTATAVKEHLRSQLEDSGGSPTLTKNEIELVRFISEGSFRLARLPGWRRFPRDQEGTALIQDKPRECFDLPLAVPHGLSDGTLMFGPA